MSPRHVVTVLACVAMAGCGDNTRAAPCEASSSSGESGRVFLDRDGDGVFSAGDDPVAGVAVFYEDKSCVITDANGRYAMSSRDKSGIVWVRGNDDVEPGPHHAVIDAGVTVALDFALAPARTNSTFSFVVASDTHAGIDLMPVEDQLIGLGQAVSLRESPAFIAVTGDLTQSNRPEQFETLGTAIESIDVPYVPVPGNHDWYDGGEAYRSFFGPPSYSFDAGGVHFAVLNDASSLEDRLNFLDKDLALNKDDRDVVVMMHAPPRTDLRNGLESRGISMLLTGHMHANRVLLHDNFLEFNTQPLVMGGIDMTPGGYRVFERTEAGEIEVRHRNIVNQDVAVLVSPSAALTASPCDAQVIASIQTASETVAVSADVEGVGMVLLEPRGDWIYASDPLGLCDDGSYSVTLTATFADGETATLSGSLEVSQAPARAAPRDWSAFQGGPSHLGQASWTGEFPERSRWVGDTGGNLHGGSPILHGSRVFVSVSDFGDGLAGGVVAFDALSGEKLWEHRVGFSVPHAPTAAGDAVFFVSNDGTLHSVDASTGALRFTYELAPGKPPVQRNLYSSPTIVDGVVFAGGRHEFAAVDAETGNVVWSLEPLAEFGDLDTHASQAAADGVVVVPFSRRGGLFVYDAELGTELWSAPADMTVGIQGSPVIADGTVYVINELMQLSALDLRTGDLRWARTIEGGAFGWGYLSSATPTVGDGQIFVATQRGSLIALDRNTGTPQWIYRGEDSLIRATHYHGLSPALSAAPTSTPSRLWVPGTDGSLRVLDSATGAELWRRDFGVPITSSVVLAGDIAFVATFDGIVHALEARSP